MQPGTLSFLSFDPDSNILQIFEDYRTTPFLSSFRYNLFSNTVVRVSNCARFVAGDFPQALFSRLGTFALKALPMCQKLISFSSKRPTSQQLSCREGSQHIFPKIHADLVIGWNQWRIWKIQNQVKKPAIAPSDQLCLAGLSLFQKIFVKRTELYQTAKSFLQSKKRKALPLQRIGSLIEMDRASSLKEKFLGFFQSPQRLRCFCNRIAHHLSAQFREFFSQSVISQVMEFHPISLFGLEGNLSNKIASCRKLGCKPLESLLLNFRKSKLDCNGSFHGKKYIHLFNFKPSKEERQFLPVLKDWVSLPSSG
jgi:hypothetical protein